MAQQLAFAFFSAISIILVILPSPWHWKSRNIGTLLYIGWVLLANLVYLVNSIVWWSSAENVAPVWCDISE
jgi:pheromone a factor receptor